MAKDVEILQEFVVNCVPRTRDVWYARDHLGSVEVTEIEGDEMADRSGFCDRCESEVRVESLAQLVSDGRFPGIDLEAVGLPYRVCAECRDDEGISAEIEDIVVTDED